jgi:hypothetical protein
MSWCGLVCRGGGLDWWGYLKQPATHGFSLDSMWMSAHLQAVHPSRSNIYVFACGTVTNAPYLNRPWFA